MELWKIGVIVALIAGIVGYKFYDEQQPPPTPAGNTAKTPEPPSPLLGKAPPPWNIPAADWANTTKPVTLESLKGSVSFVEIFRTECSHCQEAAPMLAVLAQHYQKSGVKFVGLQSPGDLTNPSNPEADWPAVKTWLKERNIQYPIGFDRDSKYFQGTFPLDKKLYPCMFVLDKTGKIVLFQTGEDEEKMVLLIAAIEKQLGTGPALQGRLKTLAKILLGFPRFAGETEPGLVKALTAAVEGKTPPKPAQ